MPTKMRSENYVCPIDSFWPWTEFTIFEDKEWDLRGSEYAHLRIAKDCRPKERPSSHISMRDLPDEMPH